MFSPRSPSASFLGASFLKKFWNQVWSRSSIKGEYLRGGGGCKRDGEGPARMRGVFIGPTKLKTCAGRPCHTSRSSCRGGELRFFGGLFGGRFGRVVLLARLALLGEAHRLTNTLAQEIKL